MKSTSLTSEEIASLTRKGLIKPRIAPDQQPHAPGCPGPAFARSDAPGRIDPKHIIMTVAQTWKVEISEVITHRGNTGNNVQKLSGCGRPHRIAAMHLLRHAAEMGATAIGRMLGGVSHGTVSHSRERFAMLMATDRDFSAKYLSASAKIAAMCSCGRFAACGGKWWEGKK